MKTTYEFAINKEGLVKETEESVNEEGQKVTITKDVVSQVPHNYFIKKPTRVLWSTTISWRLLNVATRKALMMK